MIIGIGNDILEMKRVTKACEKESFLVRCFTAREQEASGGKMSFYGGNFCVKEATAKALGTGFVGFGPKDIEVLRHESGKPYVVLYGNARKLADELGAINIYVSISNLKDLVSAVVIIEGQDGD